MTILKKILHGLFKDDIETKDSEIQSLKDSLSAEKQVSSEKDSQIHLLEAASYSLRQEVENLTRSIISLEEEADVLRLELENAQDYNTSFKKEIRSLKGQIELYKENALREARRAEELLGALAPLRMELGDARRKLSTLQREYNSIVADFDNFKLRSEEDMEGSRSEHQAVFEQLDAVRSEKDRLQILIGEYLLKISELEERHALESESHGRALASLRSQVEDRNHEIDTKEDEIINLELTIQKLHETISDIRKSKDSIDTKLKEKEEECAQLQSTLKEISDKNSHIFETERSLFTAQQKIDELEQKILSLPREEDLISRDSEIADLKQIISVLKSQIESSHEDSSHEDSQKEETSSEKAASTSSASNTPEGPKKSRTAHRKFNSPYIPKPSPLAENILKTKDFPPIENDNIYGLSRRMIDKVYDCRTNKLISADSILENWSAKEISDLRNDLDEALHSDKPYLTCPCCGQMLKLSGRTVGSGDGSHTVSYFIHAVRNISCDLKQNYSSDIEIDGTEADHAVHTDYHTEICNQIKVALTSENSIDKGISDVEVSCWIKSEELDIMNRRLADVIAIYKGKKIVFELVTPATNLSKVRDRDIFYYINYCHVFWLFGLNSTEDYNELLRSVAKDIIFLNKRNVFVFDIEARQESLRRGELILKCNWLDENDEWEFQFEKNGKNGILVSLDEITFDDDYCRPYYRDADELYYKKNPSEERPEKLSREEYKKTITEVWGYKTSRTKATKETETTAIEKHSDGPNHLEKIPLLIHGYYAVKGENGLWGIESINGEVSHIYEGLRPWKGNLYRAKRTGVWGIIDITKNINSSDRIFHSFEFSEISDLENNRALVKVGNRTFYINSDCQNTDEVIYLQEGYQKIRKEGRWGIIAPDGSVVVAPEYDEITTMQGKLIGFSNNSVCKLNKNFPYWLPIWGKSISSEGDNLDLIDIQGVTCILLPKRKEIKRNEYIKVILLSLTEKSEYPKLKLYDKNIHTKRIKHIRF